MGFLTSRRSSGASLPRYAPDGTPIAHSVTGVEGEPTSGDGHGHHLERSRHSLAAISISDSVSLRPPVPSESGNPGPSSARPKKRLSAIANFQQCFGCGSGSRNTNSDSDIEETSQGRLVPGGDSFDDPDLAKPWKHDDPALAWAPDDPGFATGPSGPQTFYLHTQALVAPHGGRLVPITSVGAPAPPGMPVGIPIKGVFTPMEARPANMPMPPAPAPPSLAPGPGPSNMPPDDLNPAAVTFAIRGQGGPSLHAGGAAPAPDAVPGMSSPGGRPPQPRPLPELTLAITSPSQDPPHAQLIAFPPPLSTASGDLHRHTQSQGTPRASPSTKIRLVIKCGFRMDNLSGAEPGSFSKLVDVPREGPLSHVENLCRGVAGLPPHADMSLAFLLPGAGAGSDNELMNLETPDDWEVLVSEYDALPPGQRVRVYVLSGRKGPSLALSREHSRGSNRSGVHSHGSHGSHGGHGPHGAHPSPHHATQGSHTHASPLSRPRPHHGRSNSVPGLDLVQIGLDQAERMAASNGPPSARSATSHLHGIASASPIPILPPSGPLAPGPHSNSARSRARVSRQHATPMIRMGSVGDIDAMRDAPSPTPGPASLSKSPHDSLWAAPPISPGSASRHKRSSHGGFVHPPPRPHHQRKGSLDGDPPRPISARASLPTGRAASPVRHGPGLDPDSARGVPHRHSSLQGVAAWPAAAVDTAWPSGSTLSRPEHSSRLGGHEDDATSACSNASVVIHPSPRDSAPRDSAGRRGGQGPPLPHRGSHSDAAAAIIDEVLLSRGRGGVDPWHPYATSQGSEGDALPLARVSQGSGARYNVKSPGSHGRPDDPGLLSESASGMSNVSPRAVGDTATSDALGAGDSMDSPRAPLYSPQSTTPSHLGRIEEEPRGRVWGSGLARKDAHRSSRHLRKRSVEDIVMKDRQDGNEGDDEDARPGSGQDARRRGASKPETPQAEDTVGAGDEGVVGMGVEEMDVSWIAELIRVREAHAALKRQLDRHRRPRYQHRTLTQLVGFFRRHEPYEQLYSIEEERSMSQSFGREPVYVDHGDTDSRSASDGGQGTAGPDPRRRAWDVEVPPPVPEDGDGERGGVPESPGGVHAAGQVGSEGAPHLRIPTGSTWAITPSDASQSLDGNLPTAVLPKDFSETRSVGGSELSLREMDRIAASQSAAEDGAGLRGGGRLSGGGGGFKPPTRLSTASLGAAASEAGALGDSWGRGLGAALTLPSAGAEAGPAGGAEERERPAVVRRPPRLTLSSGRDDAGAGAGAEGPGAAGAAGADAAAAERDEPERGGHAGQVWETISRQSGQVRRAGDKTALPMLVVGSQAPVGRWNTHGQWEEEEPLPEPEVPSTLQQIPPGDLTKVRELGRGQFGAVWHERWRGVDVAVKELHGVGVSARTEMIREAATLATLRHPCVVGFFGIILSDGLSATVLEFVRDGNLKKALQTRVRRDGRLRDGSRLRRLCLQIALSAARGMEYLHSQSIVHFDLKADNLLCDLRDLGNPVVKVGDLGLSQQKAATFVSGKMRGTIPWMAPELFGPMARDLTAEGEGSGNASDSPKDEHGDGGVTEKVDVFSFGVTMWEIWTLGETPYSGVPIPKVLQGVMGGTLRPEVPADCDAGWASLMQRCWHNRAPSRPSFSEICRELETMVSLCDATADDAGDE